MQLKIMSSNITREKPKIEICSIEENNQANKTVACFHNWDNMEKIDGYTLNELYEMREQINDAINSMIFDCSNQLSLFGD